MTIRRTNRPRLGALVSAALIWVTAGSSPLGATAISLIPAGQIASGDSVRMTFEASRPLPGRCRVLVFNARMESERFNGSNVALGLMLNGAPVPAARPMNKPLLFSTARHVLMSWGDDSQLRVVYSPRFAADLNARAGEHRILAVDPYRFELRVEDLLHEGTNQLVLRHRLAGLPALQWTGLRIEDRACDPVVAAAKPAPAASDVLVQAPAPGPPVTARIAADGSVAIRCDALQSQLDTEVSIPRGGWRSLSRPEDWRVDRCEPSRFAASARGVRVARTVAPRGEYVEVVDTWYNTTTTPQGFIVRYRLQAARGDEVWLGGVQIPPIPRDLARYEPQTPSAVGVGGAGALGLLPANDTFWVHAESFRDAQGYGLADPQLCIPPQDSVQLAVRILASVRGDAYDWNSRARRMLGSEIPLRGSFAFGTFAMSTWAPERLRDWIRIRGLEFLASPAPTASGSHGLQGPALLGSDAAQKSLRSFAAAVHRASPDTKVLAYFHSYLINSKALQPAFKSQQMRFLNGVPAFYPRSSAPTEFAIVIPAAGTAFARRLEEVVQLYWDLGFDGLYWDEMSFSYRPWTYGGEGDGVSGDVDSTSHLLLRVKTSIPLAVQPWVRGVLAAARARGKVVVANTQAATFSMHQEALPRFVETPDDLSIAAVALGTPIALADRRRERDGRDAARRMWTHLENGALYYYYSPAVEIAAPQLASYQFPVTPWIARPGLIAGPERILTSRPGRFGWGDASAHEVHVFGADGSEQRTGSHTALSGGRMWTNLTLPAGGTAVIVRSRTP